MNPFFLVLLERGANSVKATPAKRARPFLLREILEGSPVHRRQAVVGFFYRCSNHFRQSDPGCAFFSYRLSHKVQDGIIAAMKRVVFVLLVIVVLVDAWGYQEQPNRSQSPSSQSASSMPASPEENAIREYIEAFKVNDWHCSYPNKLGPSAAASGKLVKMGKRAVPALIDALGNENDAIRHGAAYTLGQIRPISKDVVPALIEAMSDSSADVRSAAICALGDIGPAAKAAIPDLLKAMKNKSFTRISVWALGDIGPDAVDAVPALVAGLKSEDEDIRSSCVNALGEIGSKAKEHLGEIASLASDKSRSVRESVFSTLEKLDPGTTLGIDVLIQSLKCSDIREAIRLVEILGELGPEASKAVPVLIGCLASEDFELREAAAFSLGKIGNLATGAIPALRIVAVTDPEGAVRALATEAIERICYGLPKPIVSLEDILEFIRAQFAFIVIFMK